MPRSHPPRLSTTAAAYFENICDSLESEEGMRAYCRDTFNDSIPEIDKDARDRIVLDLNQRYLFDAKSKLETWGIVLRPNDLIDKYADRILAKLVKKKPIGAKKSNTKKKASVQVENFVFNWENYFHDKYLGMALANRVLRDELESARARISLLENQLRPLQKN